MIYNNMDARPHGLMLLHDILRENKDNPPRHNQIFNYFKRSIVLINSQLRIFFRQIRSFVKLAPER